MSIISFLLKPKKEMAKANTRHVHMGKYTITSHAQNRLVDPLRKLKKKDMFMNLFGKTSKNSRTYKHRDGTVQYDRVNNKNKTITRITQNGNRVKTIQKYHNTKKGKEYAYKNF